MSRIGKSPVQIPDKVSVDINGLTVTVKGPKGELKRLMPEGVSFDQKDNQIVVTPITTKRYSRERHGLCRTLISNMVQGVSQGYSKKLEIVGVGSRARGRHSRPPRGVHAAGPRLRQAGDATLCAGTRNATGRAAEPS